MKTKIASFLSIVALSLLTLTTGAFADAEEGFYEKDHVRGFISIGADYRGMRKAYADYVNTVARGIYASPYGVTRYGHYIKMTVPNEDGSGVDTVSQFCSGNYSYNKFNDYYLGLHVNIGAQYKQFMTWFDLNFMPPQVSERKASSYTVQIPDGATPAQQITFPLYDVEWFTYGADWMFAWKLFGESAPINLIPAVGFGFSLMNMHFGSNFNYVEVDNKENVTQLRDRFYSTLATTVNAELELRIELGRFALGAYGGYRFVRYNDIQREAFTTDVTNWENTTDNVGDTYFFGIRATWYFLSLWEKKLNDKL